MQSPFMRAAVVAVGLAVSADAQVVVETVEYGGAAAARDVREGRVLSAWSLVNDDGRVLERGMVEDPFDFERVRIEHGARGTIRFDDDLVLDDEEWGLVVGPTRNDSTAIAWRWIQEAGARLAAADDPRAEYATFDAVFARADGVLRDVPEDRAVLRRRWGRHALERGRFDVATTQFEGALALDVARAPDGVAAALDVLRLGQVAARKRLLPDAKAHYERALATLRDATRPGSLLAEALASSALLELLRGDLAAADAALAEARAIVDDRGLEGRAARLVLANRGSLVRQRGDFAGALALFDRAAEISESAGWRDRSLGTIHMNRSVCLRRLGDYDGAERAARSALDVHRGVVPVSLDVANVHMVLGSVVSARRDADAAHLHYRRALEVLEIVGPESLSLGLALINLGANEADRGNLDRTEDYYDRARALFETAAPGGPYHLHVLRNLADLRRGQGRPEEATPLTQRILDITRERAPGGLEVADLQQTLAADALRRGDEDDALARYREVDRIRSVLAPQTLQAAEVQLRIGDLLVARGELEDATDCFCDAVDALDALRARFGGTETAHVRLAQQYGIYAGRCLKGLVDLGRPRAALAVLERSRARFLSRLFANREGFLERDLPADLLERRRAHRDAVDAVLASMASTSADDAMGADTSRQRLAALEVERQQIEAAIRRRAPRIDAFEAFATLDADAIVASLDPGTLYAAYWTGNGEEMVFVVDASGRIDVHALDVDRSALEPKVDEFRRVLADGAATAFVDDAASALYDLLIAPFADRIAGAERLLVSGQDALRELPFAALRDAEGRHLVESLPVHVVDSMTLYARLRDGRSDGGLRDARVVAFGDPVLDEGARDDAEVPIVVAMRERGRNLGALPAAREEAGLLASLFDASVHLGADATEDRVRSLDADVDILHFACHAVADREIPSASALLLAPGRENGVLQAWEVLEDLRIDAELVTLSACETAVGASLGGEGIAGLTRAFQFAGARSVVASLWRLPDAPTARLMAVFYENLADGVAKDEALRRAQVDLLRHPIPGEQTRAVGGLVPDDARSGGADYSWAALQLIGDWR